jgi:hypothetical protein
MNMRFFNLINLFYHISLIMSMAKLRFLILETRFLDKPVVRRYWTRVKENEWGIPAAGVAGMEGATNMVDKKTAALHAFWHHEVQRGG